MNLVGMFDVAFTVSNCVFARFRETWSQSQRFSVKKILDLSNLQFDFVLVECTLDTVKLSNYDK